MTGWPERVKRWSKKTLRPLLKKQPVLSDDIRRLVEHTRPVMPKILVFKKTTTPYIPHRWAPLQTDSAAGQG